MTATARRRPSRGWRSMAGLALLGALSLAGCGDQATPDEAATTADADATTEEAAVAEATPDLSGEPPTELVVEQLAPPADANAPEAAAGDFVAVEYTGRAWSTGEVFDSSEGRAPFTFELGAGEVIPGWDQGIAGLQVGERARLTIPPELAYGESGVGPIGPGETLVFDVELVDILEPSQTGSPTETGTEG